MFEIAEVSLRIVIFALGAGLVARTLLSAVLTFVLPRGAPEVMTRGVFVGIRFLFDTWLWRARSYEERDHIMALYAPLSLLVLPVVWISLVLVGYTGMYWAFGVSLFLPAFTLSGSSLLTLGYADVRDLPTTILSFSEATIGLGLVALLIAYLPTMYSSLSRRETAVTLLEVRAGSPPSAVEMLIRFHRLARLDRLTDLWESWEGWFAEIEESHTSLGALAYFRSPRSHRSWVTAAGAVLDAASLTTSILDRSRDPQAELCIRAGYLSLRHIAGFFGIPHDPDPRPDHPISISRNEFDDAYDRLAREGVPLKPDREQGWRDFAGWRVNYDIVLIALAALTMAPLAPWSSDRSLVGHPPLWRGR